MASPSAVVAATTTSILHSLPAVILPHVCGYLSTKEVLVTLAQTSNRTRELLTPACFSSHAVLLSTEAQCDICSLGPPSCNAVRSFHSRVLSECRLYVQLENSSSLPKLLASLDCFPTCRTLNCAHGSNGYSGLSDPAMHGLLHHPTVLSCRELQIKHFYHRKAEPVAIDEKEAERMLDVRVTRSMKRKRDPRIYKHTKAFDWSDISLPSLTRLHLIVCGTLPYVGGAEFLRAHTALSELQLSPLLVSVDELTTVFRDAAALPKLARFGMHRSGQRDGPAHEVTALQTALATTVVGVTGSVRPVVWLNLQHTYGALAAVFASAAKMPSLETLEVSTC